MPSRQVGTLVHGNRAYHTLRAMRGADELEGTGFVECESVGRGVTGIYFDVYVEVVHFECVELGF